MTTGKRNGPTVLSRTFQWPHPAGCSPLHHPISPLHLLLPPHCTSSSFFDVPPSVMLPRLWVWYREYQEVSGLHGHQGDTRGSDATCTSSPAPLSPCPPMPVGLGAIGVPIPVVHGLGPSPSREVSDNGAHLAGVTEDICVAMRFGEARGGRGGRQHL